jgi:hypothetical protein
MEHSIAVYKYVFNSKFQYRSELEIVIRTTPHVNISKCFKINSVSDGQPLKPLYITTEEALHFVAPFIDEAHEKDDEYFMVISDDQNLKFPVRTTWHDVDDSTDDDFSNSEISIIKPIIPNSTFWTRLWNFLNMEL